MPQFIPLNNFKAHFDSQSSLISGGGLHKFVIALKSDAVKEDCLRQEISLIDLKLFTKSLENPSTIIFQGWISQNEVLIDFLTKNSLGFFSDKSGSLNHTLTNAFKKYISPFLADKLLSFSTENDTELEKAFSFLQLLDTDHRALVESYLFISIKDRIQQLDLIQKTTIKEQELVNQVKPLCSNEILACINSLSKGSYALKIGYVDIVLNTVESPACTIRFANWVIKQLELIHLNKEHEDKLYELKTSLKKGKIEVKNQGEGRTPIRITKVVSNVVLLLIITAAALFIYSKPFSVVEDVETKYASSFKVFTKKERKEIDSLLQTLDNGFKIEEPSSDPGLPLYSGGVTLQLRKDFVNKLMERIYDDLSKDAEISIGNIIDSCKQKEVDFQTYPGVKHLSQRKGKYDTEIKNKSEFDAVLYVAEPSSKGKVYSLLLKQNETLLISLNESDILTLVAGNHFSNFEFNQNTSKPNLPSADFKYHFCDTEVSYEESINTSFQLNITPSKTIKLMLMGTTGSYFKVVDIYGSLESY